VRVIGLTGGIASGKSTVARLLGERGAPIVDADQLARRVVEPGQPALDDIVKQFGRELLDESGALDRKKMAQLVFADAAKRRMLNAITHPRIALETQRELERLRASGAPLTVYEAALLVENGVYHGLDGLIVVAVDEAHQRQRLRARDRLDDAEIDARLSSQAPLADKLAAATWVIDNNGSLDDTRAQVDALWEKIR
jgi:dephospho-CoA kinase